MSHFEGMSLREMDGMPMVGEATGIMLSNFIPASQRRYAIHPLLSRVALRQERYVREVRLRCPSWRRRKRRALSRALAHAELVTNLALKARPPR